MYLTPHAAKERSRRRGAARGVVARAKAGAGRDEGSDAQLGDVDVRAAREQLALGNQLLLRGRGLAGIPAAVWLGELLDGHISIVVAVGGGGWRCRKVNRKGRVHCRASAIKVGAEVLEQTKKTLAWSPKQLSHGHLKTTAW